MFAIICIGDKMKIEKITKLKSGKYKLKLEDGSTIITYDDVIIKNNLLYSKNINMHLQKNIYKQTEYFDIYNKIVKMISTKYRSEKEIRKYLEDKNITESEKEQIIKRLKENSLIDDERFVKCYINDRLNLSNDGPGLIFKNLSEYVDNSIISKYIEEIDEEVVIDKLTKQIEKKIKTNKDSFYIMKQKLLNHFKNKGYETSMILDILNNYKIDNKENINKEYQKLYNKLSKKYSGNELIYKIKQKLYAKGYTQEDINNTFIND